MSSFALIATLLEGRFAAIPVVANPARGPERNRWLVTTTVFVPSPDA
jgi:hypothetical protein